MKRITIYKMPEDTVIAGADMADPTAWIAGEVAKNSWGLPARPDTDFVPGEGQTPADAPILPATYRYDIVDFDQAAEILAALRSGAVNALQTDPSPASKFVRAFILLAIDEINILRQRDVDRTTDVAAASSLADLKTRWAARSALSDRTVNQFKTAIVAKINAGSAD
jgi:hypothetical protein